MKSLSEKAKRRLFALGTAAGALLMAAVLIFCFVRVETPSQRQERLAQSTLTVSAAVSRGETASSLSAEAGELAKPASGESAAEETSSKAEAPSPAEASSASSQTAHASSETASTASTAQSAESAAQTPSASEAESSGAEKPVTCTATMKIVGANANEDILLDTTAYSWSGEKTVTAWDIFRTLCDQNGVAYAFKSWPSVYIQGIGGLYEKDPRYSSTCGWMYAVNGTPPNVSVDRYTMQDGDVLLFYYVTDITTRVPE